MSYISKSCVENLYDFHMCRKPESTIIVKTIINNTFS